MLQIHVFDEDKLSRRVWDRTWPNLGVKKAENDPNLGPQNDPKSTKNRCPKMINNLIAKKGHRVVFLSRPGGMRRPPGGIIGGSKNSLFEICRYLRHIMALRFGDFGCRSGTLGSAPPGRAADSIASRIGPCLANGESEYGIERNVGLVGFMGLVGMDLIGLLVWFGSSGESLFCLKKNIFFINLGVCF